ncbi:MAG: cytochrome c biogenesis protein ResB [Thermodesulfobacteriota bacterium]|nr:cytochrome c biogenesis protein ResB [Thermodesulfobacteriota bacterium]
MKKEKNTIWVFFASVKLALFTLIILAIASIIGTVIQQNQSPEFYVKQFGPTTAKLFQVLDISQMYDSWWFIFLLVLLSINLIVCTLDRFPALWSMVTRDNLATNLDRLEKMGRKKTFFTKSSPNEIAGAIASIMENSGWKSEKADKEAGGVLFFSQKGHWTRLGLIAVHTSILVIFTGAIIGKTLGYKGGLMLPETATSDHIYQHGTNKKLPLGFEIRCDRFQISFYDNGSPKEYRTNITIMENGKEVKKTSIVVNDPLDYRGFTFYQANFQPIDGQFLTHIRKENTNSEQTFRMRAGKDIAWESEGITFGIINIMEPMMGGKYRYKIWFSDNRAEPVDFWMDGSATVKIERPDTSYFLTVKQLYSTGLQIAKDPGVWWVYIGFFIMLAGLYIVFFLSHRRLWVYIGNADNRTRILVCGSANKNKINFEKDFSTLIEQFEQNDNLHLA